MPKNEQPSRMPWKRVDGGLSCDWEGFSVLVKGDDDAPGGMRYRLHGTLTCCDDPIVSYYMTERGAQNAWRLMVARVLDSGVCRRRED